MDSLHSVRRTPSQLLSLLPEVLFWCGCETCCYLYWISSVDSRHRLLSIRKSLILDGPRSGVLVSWENSFNLVLYQKTAALQERHDEERHSVTMQHPQYFSFILTFSTEEHSSDTFKLHLPSVQSWRTDFMLKFYILLPHFYCSLTVLPYWRCSSFSSNARPFLIWLRQTYATVFTRIICINCMEV